MRARLTLFIWFATIGCTRDNPAFEGSTETSESTAATGDGDPDTLTGVEAESDNGQEAPDPVCELHGGVPLAIDLGPAGCADTPEAYDRLHPLVMVEGGTLWVGSCPQGAQDCSQCESDIPTPLSFEPLDLSTIAMPGACLHVKARRSDPSNPDVCRFQSVVIEAAEGVARRPIMVGRNSSGVALPPVDNSSPLAGFNPTLEEADSCSCAEYPDDCCDGISPTVYAIDVGLEEPVAIGGMALLEYPNDTYEFKTLDAFQSGECGEPTREAWGLFHL
jgi:hypothetical protein